MVKGKYLFFTVLTLLIVGSVAADQLVIRGEGTPDPNDPNLYVSLGNYLMRQGYEERALQVYEKGLEVKETAELNNNLGVYWKNKENNKLAFSYFERAAELGSINAKTSLTILYYEQQKYTEAIALLEELIVEEPNTPEHYYDLGINIADRYRETGEGNLRDAIVNFQKAEALEPGFGYAQENMQALQKILKSESLR